MDDKYNDDAARSDAGGVLAIALIEELQKAGILTASQVRSIYLDASQRSGGLSNAFHVETLLTDLAKNVRKDG